MAEDRPTLNVGNTIENCAIRNKLLSDGSINVTDVGTSSVNIGDRVQGVTTNDATFRNKITYCNSSNNSAETVAPAVLLATTSDLQGAGFHGYTKIGNTNQHVTANILHNEMTVNVGVPPESKLRPIIFGYRALVDDFIGREKELNFLKEKLCNENSRVVVVSGLGGIGKTQLVKKFIEENREFYGNILWILSQGRTSIEEEFKTLAKSELDLSLNVNGQERDFRSIIHMVFHKLSTRKTLLVFDNVDKADTAEIVLDIVSVRIKPHILITSRIQYFSDSIELIKLEVFSSEEALKYISKKLDIGNDTESLTDKMALAAILKNLPLALRQATGHLQYNRKRNGNYKIRNYIADFNKYRKKILNSDLFQKDIFNQYKDTTLTTWQITMNAISKDEQHGELALRILHIMAYFDSFNIIREIFLNLQGLSSESEMKESEVTSAVELIVNYSMVVDYESQSVLSIHKLVQEVIKIQLENEQRSESTLRDGLHLISQMEGNENFKLCLEHGISVYLSALRFKELVTEFDAYPSMILQNLEKSGKYLLAFSFGNEVNEPFAAILGMDHQSTTDLQLQIANSYGNLGKYSEALRMFEEVLEKRKIILGEDHPGTIIAKQNIALSYDNLGKHSEALRMYEEVLEKRKIILGEDHPYTINAKHNIAQLYSDLGKHSKALRMFEEVLEKRKIILGEDHPHTINAKHNIAQLYNDLGKHSKALRMFEEVLEKRKIILGEDHPHTINAKHNIARSYDNLGKHSEALRMFEEVLEKRKIILGEDHPDTIIAKHNIARSYDNLGKHSEALRMYEEVLEKSKIILGEDHPDTIIAKHNIAHSYSNLGKYSEALRMYEEVLEKRKIILGEDHPHTINAKHNIARSYDNLGKHSEALRMFEEVLEKRKIILGEDHPKTIIAKHDIARSYVNLGKDSEALRMFEEVLEKMKIIFGEDHPHTINAKHNIARSYDNLGKHSEALRMFEEVLEKRKIILGEDHPLTIHTKSRIVYLNKKSGIPSENECLRTIWKKILCRKR